MSHMQCCLDVKKTSSSITKPVSPTFDPRRMYGRNFNAPRSSRGSRGGSFSYNPNQGRSYQKKEPSVEQLMKGLSSEIETIPAPSSDAGNSNAVSIEGFEAVASYSWLDSSVPTVIVPGQHYN